MGEGLKQRRPWKRAPRAISVDNLSFTIEGAMSVTGLGKTRLYELIADGKLDARKDGRRTLITGDSIRAYIANLPKWSPARAA